MATGMQFRQSVFVLFCGGGLVVAGMTDDHPAQAMAVPLLPKAEDLPAAFHCITSEALPSEVFLEGSRKSQQVPLRGEGSLRSECTILNGRLQTLHITIDEPSKNAPAPRRLKRDQDDSRSKLDKFGLDVRTLTSDLARQFDLKAATGVIVVDVDDGSVADQAGIKAGDIIETAASKPLSRVEDYEQVKADNISGHGMELMARSSNGYRFFVVLKID
jgi:C-terminal processing protease CtpA/Prc